MTMMSTTKATKQNNSTSAFVEVPFTIHQQQNYFHHPLTESEILELRNSTNLVNNNNTKVCFFFLKTKDESRFYFFESTVVR